MSDYKEPTLVRLDVANNALLEVPLQAGKFRKSSSWMAIIDVDGTSPGGLSRKFLPRGKGECHYMVEQVSLFDAIEFAADVIRYSGKKDPVRWYGVVVAITDSALVVEQTASGGKAVLRAKAARVSPVDRKGALLVQRTYLEKRIAEIDQEISVLEEPKEETHEGTHAEPATSQ